MSAILTKQQGKKSIVPTLILKAISCSESYKTTRTVICKSGDSH
ncbi:hypothetical protein V6N13_017112 [Hibiscus sabdariffa]